MRAYKHVLQALVAATNSTFELAASIAAALNVMLGTFPEDDESLISKWVETFVGTRFGWKLKGGDTRKDLRKYAVLRGLCHKVQQYMTFLVY